MKAKHLAVLISVCCAMPALAQTSITIYGIADAGIQASRFGNGTQYNLASGMTGADSARWPRFTICGPIDDPVHA